MQDAEYYRALLTGAYSSKQLPKGLRHPTPLTSGQIYITHHSRPSALGPPGYDGTSTVLCTMPIMKAFLKWGENALTNKKR